MVPHTAPFSQGVRLGAGWGPCRVPSSGGAGGHSTVLRAAPGLLASPGVAHTYNHISVGGCLSMCKVSIYKKQSLSLADIGA